MPTLTRTDNASCLVLFKRGINISHAEDFITFMSGQLRSPSPLVLDFTKCEHIDPGAAWRIGNAVALLRRVRDFTLIVLVPDAGHPPKPDGRWFKLFTRSGLGISLVAYASAIRAQDRDITGHVAEYYRSIFVGFVQQSQNSVTTIQLRGSHINLSSESSFFKQHLAPSLRLCNFVAETVANRDIFSLNTLCYQAIQNVAEHSDKDPTGSQLSVVSYFALRYHSTLGSELAAPGDFRSYLERVKTLQGRGFEQNGFLELIINDDGVGIPARQSQDPDIYGRNILSERRALQEALETGGSIKVYQNDAPVSGRPGYGYTFIRECLRNLKAYAVLRTGRSLLIFDGSARSHGGFVLDRGLYGHMPGTTLHILVPIPQIQPRLEGL